MKSFRYNPFVITKKTVFMQRIADLVRSGHHNYVAGSVSIEKGFYLAEKFNKLYLVDRTDMQSSRARKQGEATARLLFWLPNDESESLQWILLKTDGVDYLPVEKPENWQSALIDKQRITLDGYELVRQTKPGRPTPVWTWKYTRIRHDEIRTAIVSAIRHHQDEVLKQLIHSLWRSPGFGGVREQVKKIKDFIRAEWKRVRHSADSMPEIPEHLGYVRRLPDKGSRLSEIQKKQTILLDN